MNGLSFWNQCALHVIFDTHRTLFTIFWLGISYRGNPNRKQPILAPKSQQVIFSMICYQNSNAVCSKVNKVRRQFLSSTRVEYDMKDTNVKKMSITENYANSMYSKIFSLFQDYLGNNIYIKKKELVEEQLIRSFCLW